MKSIGEHYCLLNSIGSGEFGEGTFYFFIIIMN